MSTSRRPPRPPRRTYCATASAPIRNSTACIAEWEGTPAGFALYFYNYSTWKGRSGIFLDDLFVWPEYRGKGIGKALLLHVARIAVAENCGRYEWLVLDWNTPAIEFYESLGAKRMKQWLPVRVEGEALLELAKKS